MNCRLRRQENREKLETQVRVRIFFFFLNEEHLCFSGTQRIFEFEICNEILILGLRFQKITLLPSKSVRSTNQVPIHPTIKVASWIENPRETGVLSGSPHVSFALFIIWGSFFFDEKSKGKICHQKQGKNHQ